MSALAFTKTAQGRTEIESRSAGLAAKARRLLILVDGQRTLAELAAASGLGDELGAFLQQLLAAGMIEAPSGATTGSLPTPLPLAGTLPVPEAAAPAVPQPPATPAAAAITLDPARMQQAKQLMLDSVQTYLGLMGRDITARITAAEDLAALKSCVARWTTAMRETRDGSAVVARYLEDINACLR